MPPGSLGQVLQTLGTIEHPDLLAGHRGFEDAGIFRVESERALVQTVDFFPPIVDDPRWFGRIAAANALSDVYAMGGRPVTAMNLVGWPKDLDLNLLAEILQGGLEKVREAGAVLCGGHSVSDAEIKFGLSVTGFVHPQKWWPNSGAKDGDALLLTKPVGMGPVSTAIKRQKAGGVDVQRAMELMATLNRAACEAMVGAVVHGATDVTGFGLVGHAHEMAAGSGLVLLLRASALPVFPGALELVRGGVTSGGCSRGKQHFGPKTRIEKGVEPALTDLCFDAETSGGLLLAVPESFADEAQRRILDAGAPCAARIGSFRQRQGDEPLLQFVAG